MTAPGQSAPVVDQWGSAILLAHANGASLRDIARAAEVSPQTVANLCDKHRSR